MQKILISMPDSILSRLKAVIPDRKRSKFISTIVERELKKQEQTLFQCALKVERDKALNAEMDDWNSTISDGLKHESW